MLCSICNKNLATVHIQEVVNGVKKALHICQSCAAAKGIKIPGIQNINLAEFLQQVAPENVKIAGNPTVKINEPEFIVTCPKCGWDNDKLKKTGKLGCPDCYHSLKDFFSPSLSAMHRGAIHCGKVPPAVDNGRNVLVANLLKLQKKLEKHVKNEEYEEAAKIRDEIKDINPAIPANK